MSISLSKWPMVPTRCRRLIETRGYKPPIAPDQVGKEQLTKPEAARKVAEIIRSAGEHHRTTGTGCPSSTGHDVQDRIVWCRRNHKAWTDGKPGPIATMEGQLAKYILPRFGACAAGSITETMVQ
jgi:hypothetical protein